MDLDHPFQRRWYIRQVLLHGQAEDLRTIDLDEVAGLLDELNLPPHLHRLWKAFWRPGVLRGKGLLRPLQRHFLDLWVSFPEQASFYLTGGTALAEF